MDLSEVAERFARDRHFCTLYRQRWRIEGMFQRLESALNSELRSLDHPRAALLGFAVAVLAHNEVLDTSMPIGGAVWGGFRITLYTLPFGRLRRNG